MVGRSSGMIHPLLLSRALPSAPPHPTQTMPPPCRFPPHRHPHLVTPASSPPPLHPPAVPPPSPPPLPRPPSLHLPPPPPRRRPTAARRHTRRRGSNGALQGSARCAAFAGPPIVRIPTAAPLSSPGAPPPPHRPRPPAPSARMRPCTWRCRSCPAPHCSSPTPTCPPCQPCWECCTRGEGRGSSYRPACMLRPGPLPRCRGYTRARPGSTGSAPRAYKAAWPSASSSVCSRGTSAPPRLFPCRPLCCAGCASDSGMKRPSGRCACPPPSLYHTQTHPETPAKPAEASTENKTPDNKTSGCWWTSPPA
mmetsp:Transcript_20201/g.63375  ORF Transcript_20201/g.63375 Transcript_20201/m.63375 type:complete len:308 (-) Transcript_20201:1980-2903(-)